MLEVQSSASGTASTSPIAETGLVVETLLLQTGHLPQ